MASTSDTREFEIEDIVLLIDASRSMARKDFIPSEPRINAIKNALIDWVQRKNRIDAADNYAVVSLNSDCEVLVDYTNEIDTVINAIRNLRISGRTHLGEGIATALQVVVKKMQKAGDSQSGGNVNRIIIVSDGNPCLDSKDPIELARAAAELGIIIDAIELTETMTKGSSFAGVLESMTVLGEFYQVPSVESLDLAIRSLVHKKDVFELKKTVPRLSLIAADLLDLTSLSEDMKQKVEQMKGIKLDQCAICRMKECPDHGSSCIRLCAYCKTPVHICCAQRWSKESKMDEAGVFRCPHCLFLLKNPETPSVEAELPASPAEEGVQKMPIDSPTPVPQPQRTTGSQEKKVKDAQTAKLGDFVLDGKKIKLKALIKGADRFISLKWERFGDKNYRCALIDEETQEPVCRDFHPLMNWDQMTCTGFIIKDLVGWFTHKVDPNYGVFIYDIEGIKAWGERLLADLQAIKRIMAEHTEISFSSDRLTDFQLEAQVSFTQPLDITERQTLEGNLLMGAQTYLTLFEKTLEESAKLTPVRAVAARPKAPVQEIPSPLMPDADDSAASKVVSGDSAAKSFANQLKDVKKVSLNRLATQLGMEERALVKKLMGMIRKKELEGFFLRDGYLMKKE